MINFFDFTDVTIKVLTPIPVDITEGLVLRESFIGVKKESKEVSVNVGIGGEVLISDNFHPVSMLTVEYLPNAKGASIFDAYARTSLPFGIYVSAKYPKYKGVASYCRIFERADKKIEKTGLNNQVFKIVMTDFLDT